jgi:pimeloyl-ACP methyl ester carboxylesterase
MTVVEAVVHGGQRVRHRRELLEVTTADGMRLAMVARRPLESEGHPLLLVHGLAQNRFSWHLDGRSFASYLVSRGYATFNLELRGHGLSRALGSRHPRGVEEYIELDVPAAVDRVLEYTGRDALCYLGHSLGGMIGYRLSAVTRRRIRAMVSVAGPFFFGRGNVLMRLGARFGRRLMDASIVRLVPTLPFPADLLGYGVRGGLFYFDRAHNLCPVQVWHPRSIERDVLRQRVRDGFDRTSLEILRQMLTWADRDAFSERDDPAGDRAWLKDFDTPLLCLAGDRDLAVPLASVASGFALVGARDKTLRVYHRDRDGQHFGHCDLICGMHSPACVWPEVADWLDARRPRDPDPR